MRKVMTTLHRYVAYVLNVEFRYNQEHIAELLTINQATISSAILKIRKEERDSAHYNNLVIARKFLQSRGFVNDDIFLNMDPDLLERMNSSRKNKYLSDMEE